MEKNELFLFAYHIDLLEIDWFFVSYVPSKSLSINKEQTLFIYFLLSCFVSAAPILSLFYYIFLYSKKKKKILSNCVNKV